MFWGFFGCRQKVGHIFKTAHPLCFLFLNKAPSRADGSSCWSGWSVHTSHSPDDQMNHQHGVNLFLTALSFPPCLRPISLIQYLSVCLISLPPLADSSLFIWTNFRRHFSLISSLCLFFPELQTGEELLCQSLCGQAFPAGSALRLVDFSKFWKGERVLHVPSKCLQINHSR